MIRPNPKMKYYIMFLIFLVMMTGKVTGQPVFFEKSFGTSSADIGFDIVQLSDSTLFMAGYSSSGPLGGPDFTLCRLDQYGNVQWIKHFGTPLADQCVSICIATDGGLVMAGVSESAQIQNGNDILIIKTDTAGNELWRETYGGPGNESCHWISTDSDGGYLIGGFIPDNFNGTDYYIIKTDSAGGFLWDSSPDMPLSQSIMSVIPGPSGGYFASGDNLQYLHGNYNTEYQILKFDGSGTVLWDSIYGDTLQNGCQGLISISGDRLAVFGETEISPASPFDFFLRIVDSSGTTLNYNTSGGTGTDALFDLVEDPQGTFTGCGYSNSQSGGASPINAVILRTDASGNLIWMKEYGGPGIDIAYRIISSLSGGYYISGRKDVNADTDFYLVHADQNGLTGHGELNVNNQFSISPNPAHDFTVFSWNLVNKPESLLIRDIRGRVIKAVSVSGLQRYQLELNQLPPGIYISELHFQDRSALNGRFVKIQ